MFGAGHLAQAATGAGAASDQRPATDRHDRAVGVRARRVAFVTDLAAKGHAAAGINPGDTHAHPFGTARIHQRPLLTGRDAGKLGTQVTGLGGWRDHRNLLFIVGFEDEYARSGTHRYAVTATGTSRNEVLVGFECARWSQQLCRVVFGGAGGRRGDTAEHLHPSGEEVAA